MGNSGSASPARLGKDHVPHLEWKIHDFSALLETGAKSAKSSYFQCSGYKWLLQVTPSTKKKAGVETPYVGLCLKLCWTCLEPGHTVNAVFELSVHNHSKKMYCVYKASHNFSMDNTLSKEECLIPDMGMPNRHSTTAYLVRLDGRPTRRIAKVHDAYDGSSGMKHIWIPDMGMPNRHSTTAYLVRLDGRSTRRIAKVHDVYDGSSGMKHIWTRTPKHTRQGKLKTRVLI